MECWDFTGDDGSGGSGLDLLLSGGRRQASGALFALRAARRRWLLSAALVRSQSGSDGDDR